MDGNSSFSRSYLSDDKAEWDMKPVQRMKPLKSFPCPDTTLHQIRESAFHFAVCWGDNDVWAQKWDSECWFCFSPVLQHLGAFLGMKAYFILCPQLTRVVLKESPYTCVKNCGNSHYTVEMWQKKSSFSIPSSARQAQCLEIESALVCSKPSQRTWKSLNSAFAG